MRISVKAPGGSVKTNLCDHGREGPSSLTVTPIRKIDIMEYVQGPFARPRNRGNALHQIVFTARKEHATIADAQIYMFLLGGSVPTGGEVEIELDDRVRRLIINDATIEIVPQPLIGVMSIITYTIKFGAIHEAIRLVDVDGNELLSADGMSLFANVGPQQNLIINGDFSQTTGGSANLVSNGNFSNGSTGWDFVAGDATPPAQLDTSNGEGAVIIVAAASNGIFPELRRYGIEMTAGKTYRAAFRGKVENAGDEIRFRLAENKDGSYWVTDHGYSLITTATTTTYKTFSFYYTAKLTRSDGFLNFYFDVPKNAGNIWIDDVSVVEVPAATGWTFSPGANNPLAAFFPQNNSGYFHIPIGTPGNENPLITQTVSGIISNRTYRCVFEAKFAAAASVFSARINNWNGSIWDWGTVGVDYGRIQPTGSTEWTEYSFEIKATYSTSLRFLFSPDTDENGGDAWIRNVRLYEV
jgi:hypothetical protein